MKAAVKRSVFEALSPEAVVIYNILRNEPMAVNDLVGCLMSEPYQISFPRILHELNLLLHEELIRVLVFKSDLTENYKIRTSLTVNPIV